MEKLLDLTEWLPIEDAAKRLSDILDEKINQAEVLRLVLDGHLPLTVNFLNGAFARAAKMVAIEIEEQEDPLTDTEKESLHAKNGLLIRTNNAISTYSSNKFIDPLHYPQAYGDLIFIRDLWDLPMIGSERFDIEQRYFRSIGGPQLGNKYHEGAYVVGRDGDLHQLQDCTDSKGWPINKKLLSETAINAKTTKIPNQDDEHAPEDEPARLTAPRKKSSIKCHPALELPKDCILGIRTSAIKSFRQDLREEESPPRIDFSEAEHNSLLKLVLGMAVAAYKYDPLSDRNPATGENRGSIKADFERIGLALDADTIRKFVKEAGDRFGDLIQKQ